MRKHRPVFGLLAILVTGPVAADEGAIPLFQSTVITQPGDYVVTRDFSYTSGSGIEIAANDVTLDLNGHTISGGPCVGTDYGIRIATGTAGAIRGVVIRDGRLVGGCRGIHSDAAAPAGVRIERVEVSGTGQDGIRISNAESLEILESHVHDVAWTGIHADGGAANAFTFPGRIVGNVVEGAGLSGIHLKGLAAGEVSRNSIYGHGLSFANAQGIYLFADPNAAAGGNLIEGNSINPISGSTDDDGIRIDAGSPRNMILNNVVSQCRYGIFVRADGTRIERNVISRNTNHGIFVGDAGSNPSRNHLEENQVQDNAGASACGINFFNGNAHTFRNNNLRGNTTAVCGGASGTNTDGGGNIL